MTKYNATKGAHISQKDAQAVGEKLAELEAAGSMTPADVVKAAKPKRSPLHKFFDWDDAEAAGKHRLSQARWLVRHITVEIVVEGRHENLRAFHHVEVEQEDEYVEDHYASFRTVAADSDLSEQVVDKALAELIGWRKRYKQYKTVFGGVFDAIEEAADAVVA